MFRSLTILPLVVSALLGLYVSTAKAQTPAPPKTGPRSVQMFQGKTQNAWIAVYPPTTYSDGTPIKSGTAVKINVYRSYDGGKTFKTRVRIQSGGSGFVGQGKAGSRQKPWIDLKLQVPVENRPPYMVVLGVSAVVGKEESAINVANLTFQYFPSLKIFGSPAEASGSAAKGIKGAGPLAGTWNLDGQGTLVIHEKGGGVSGSITMAGQNLATLSGTRKGNRYSLAVVLRYEGKKYDASLDLTVSADGKRIVGTATADGQSVPLKLTVSGRTISSG